MVANPQLITDYFPANSWYVIIVNLSFMIVGLVTIPNFLNVSMYLSCKLGFDFSRFSRLLSTPRSASKKSFIMLC